MKYQFHSPHLVETHMCNLLKVIYLKYEYVILIKSLCMNKIGKDAEERVGISKFMLHAVRITKTKEAEF